MRIMGRTRETLTEDSTVCAMMILVGGPRAVIRCMNQRIGFTPPCRDCWVENIQCTFQHCKFTCLQSKLFREANNRHDGDDSDGGGELNECLECDEKMCGPQFLSCSGANRRRMGVVSDIGRDADKEQCKSVDFDWEFF